MHIVNKPYPGTQAVLRAVDLLKAFSLDRPEQSLADLALTAGLHRTTTYRLLSALQSEGMVERMGSGYRLGPALMALGARAAGSSHLRAAGRAELVALAEETGETVTIEVLVGREVLILDEAIGNHRVGTVPSLGTRWPAHTTSTGKVLLAAAVGDTGLGGPPLERLTPKSIVDRAALKRELDRVRERGYATSIEEVELGFVAVGVPVRGAGGLVVAALSVGGPRGRFSAERIGELAASLPRYAERIAARLGAEPITNAERIAGRTGPRARAERMTGRLGTETEPRTKAGRIAGRRGTEPRTRAERMAGRLGTEPRTTAAANGRSRRARRPKER